jgi:hypothetical protein
MYETRLFFAHIVHHIARRKHALAMNNENGKWRNVVVLVLASGRN